VLVLIAAAVLALVALIALVLKLALPFRASQCPPATAEWIDELSMDRYRPMMRLLDREDFQFLSTQPGYTKELATKLRIQRCQIFRAYLRNLDADFNRICMALKGVLLHSDIDRPDLASTLIQHQLAFALRRMTIQFHVVLFRYDIGAVDVSALVQLFDGMRMELRTLVPAESMSGC
jgi:hypothetical protein